MKTQIFVLVFLCSLHVSAQDPVVQQYGHEITTSDLKDYLSILAADAMEGRETGTRGQKMAAAFIKAHFQEIGLQGPVNGDYFQPVKLYKQVRGETYVRAGQNKFLDMREVVYDGSDQTDGEISVPLVFIGNANDQDLAYVDVKGKAVLLLTDEAAFNSMSRINLLREKGAKAILQCNTTSDEADFKRQISLAKRYALSDRLSLTKPDPEPGYQGAFTLSRRAAEMIMGEPLMKLKSLAQEDPKKKPLKKVKPVQIQYKTSIEVQQVDTENVLGYLEGSDKKDELVIITAHYDHIGKEQGTGDTINNGADDDGSGTVSVMEIAKVFALAKRDGKGPRRSILFMTVTGEEKGLLGSSYYTEHPVFPLRKTVADLNIDMVGRRDEVHKDSPPYVYIIGSNKLSSELHTISEWVNKTYTNLLFDYTYNDPNDPERLYYRSDHWNFAKNNIPIIFYFDGIHEDYHKPSDEVEKIEFDLLARRVQCVFYTAWEIANREQRIMPDVK